MVPKAVSEGIVFKIAAVLPPGEAVFLQIGENLRPGHGQERADNPPGLRRHAAKATKAGAPQEIDEHRLHLVVGVVRRGNDSRLGG